MPSVKALLAENHRASFTRLSNIIAENIENNNPNPLYWQQGESCNPSVMIGDHIPRIGVVSPEKTCR
jgi:hypothetical protein